MSHTQRAIRTQRAGLTLAARACSSEPPTAARRQAGTGDFITSQAELSTGRVHRLVHGCGGLWDVAIPPVHNAPSVPPTPGEHPCRQRPAYAATHLDTTSLDTEF